MRKKLLAGVMALALCSTNMPPQTIFAGEFTSGNLEEVTEETPEIFSDKLLTPDFIISQQPEPRLHRKVCITALVRLNVYHIVEELSISGGALVPVKCFLRI